MIETQEKMIGDFNISVTQMPAMRALRMQTKLIKLLGPSLGYLVAEHAHDSENADKSIPEAIKLLCENLEEKQFEDLVLELCQSVRLDGEEMKKHIIDLKFAGKLNTLFKVLRFILEVNYADFFSGDSFLKDLINQQDQTSLNKLKNV